VREADVAEKKKKKKKKHAAQALATWARLRSAGAAPIGGKPLGAEVGTANPDLKK
jgi:hypothetical protein